MAIYEFISLVISELSSNVNLYFLFVAAVGIAFVDLLLLFMLWVRGYI